MTLLALLTGLLFTLALPPRRTDMSTAHCTNCEDEYSPTEYNPSPIDPDEPRFCSDDCEVEWLEAEEAGREYDAAGQSAPVW